MQIEVKGRNVAVTDELREHVEKRFRKIDRQVSEFAVLDIEVRSEKNPAIADSEVVEATIHLKGRGHPAPGQAPPREAPRPPEGRHGDHPDQPSGGVRRGRLAGFLDPQNRRGPAATLAPWAFLTVR